MKIDLEQIIKLDKKYIINTYKRYPVCFVKGIGNYLFDINNKKYLDFFCGISTTNIGHCNKDVILAIVKQTKKLGHTSNLFYTLPMLSLAEKLSKISLGGKIFFANSGAEANECACKLARKYGNKLGKNEIITFSNSFHGRTLAMLSATGQQKYLDGFEPKMPGFVLAKFNDIESFKNAVNQNTCAVLVEPVQGEGGVNPLDEKFIGEVSEICKNQKILLMFDEVQTGFGRCGKMFGYQNYNLSPDVITLGKSLGGGLALGAIVCRPELSDILDIGSHGATFGGNPIICSASLATIKVIENKHLLKNTIKSGKYLGEKLANLKTRYSFIKDTRGIGLMWGIELEFPGREIVEKCLEKGLVINCTADKVLRLLPPLTISKKEIDLAINILDSVLKN